MDLVDLMYWLEEVLPPEEYRVEGPRCLTAAVELVRPLLSERGGAALDLLHGHWEQARVPESRLAELRAQLHREADRHHQEGGESNPAWGATRAVICAFCGVSIDELIDLAGFFEGFCEGAGVSREKMAVVAERERLRVVSGRGHPFSR